LKRKRSPKTKPTRPERESHIQLLRLASVGNNIPLLTRLKTVRNKKPITSLIIFTESEPTFRLADSNESEVTVQKKAVARAANSPRCALIKLISLSVLTFILNKKIKPIKLILFVCNLPGINNSF
jgi:hypothetical protein